MLILDVQYLEKREYFNPLHRRLINIFRILQYFPVNYPVNVGIGGRSKAPSPSRLRIADETAKGRNEIKRRMEMHRSKGNAVRLFPLPGSGKSRQAGNRVKRLKRPSLVSSITSQSICLRSFVRFSKRSPHDRECQPRNYRLWPRDGGEKRNGGGNPREKIHRPRSILENVCAAVWN